MAPVEILFANQSKAVAVIPVSSLANIDFSNALPPIPKLASVVTAPIIPASWATSIAATLASSSDIPTFKYVASASSYAELAAPPKDSATSNDAAVPIAILFCACFDNSWPIASNACLAPPLVVFAITNQGNSCIISEPISSAINTSGLIPKAPNSPLLQSLGVPNILPIRSQPSPSASLLFIVS